MKLNLYDIRLCKREEYDKLICFIRDYWNENHIFCKSKEIFEFQHGRAENGYYDFIVAVNRDTNEFHAILGFIRLSLYDGREFSNPQAICGAVWKVRNDVFNREIGKLGLGVLYYLIKLFPTSSYITLGLSKDSQTIYNALHYDFGLMKHYYILNKSLSHFEIVENPVICDYKRNDKVEIRKIELPEEIENIFYPQKNREYILNRYVNHPTYKYDILGIFMNGKLICEWITRKIEVNGSCCIRLVDMIGSLDGLGDLSKNVEDYIVGENAEYIDCYNYGIDSRVFKSLGFIEKSGNTIVPNYFEPFLKENIDMHYATDLKRPVVIFKADADQDRPNVM